VGGLATILIVREWAALAGEVCKRNVIYSSPFCMRGLG